MGNKEFDKASLASIKSIKQYNDHTNDYNNDNKENTYIKENHILGQSKPLNKDQMAIITQQMEKSICKILCDNGKTGTGSFCKLQIPGEFNFIPVLITNNHVLGEKDIIKGNSIKFSLNDDKIFHQISIDKNRQCYTNEDLDVTIIEIKKKDNIELKTYLDIDDNIYVENPDDFYKNKSIYLLHYEFGDKSEVSLGTIQNITEDSTINHKCSTDKGSSGAPIINLLNYKVIGIHKGYKEGKNFNLGSLIKKPIEDFFNVYAHQNNIEDNNNDDNNNDDDNNTEDKNNKDINNNILNKETECFLQLKTQIYKIIFKNKKSPLYLEEIKEFIISENWEKVVELCIKNRDRYLLKSILLFLSQRLRKDSILIEIVRKFPNLDNIVIEVLKDEKYDDEECTLRKYLYYTGNFEELFLMAIDVFFRCERIKDRKEYLREAKKYLNEMRANKNYEFYSNYLNDLNNSIQLKNNLLQDKIIPKDDNTSFDISLYNCYNCYDISKEYFFNENKNLVLPQKVLTYLWFKNLIMKNDITLLKEIISVYGYQKLQITPLGIAKLLFNFKFFDLSTQFIKEDLDPHNFEEKIELLKKMEKYSDIIEIVKIDKKVSKERKKILFDEIYLLSPKLRQYICSLKVNYKIK